MNLKELLVELKNDLPSDLVADILDLCNNREEKIAIENLCVQLVEFDVKLNERQLNALSRLIRECGVDRKYIAMLRTQ